MLIQLWNCNWIKMTKLHLIKLLLFYQFVICSVAISLMCGKYNIFNVLFYTNTTLTLTW